MSCSSCCGQPRELHSFPTRRSSDLPCTRLSPRGDSRRGPRGRSPLARRLLAVAAQGGVDLGAVVGDALDDDLLDDALEDRKSTRLNSSHVEISYAVFCLKKKNVCSQ